MMQQRGMFGSLARQITPFVDDPQAPPVRPVQPAAAMQAPAQAAGPRSFLGGLVKYQRPEGQTDAQRMALIGATMRDVGSSLRGGDGGAVSGILAAEEARLKEAAEQQRMSQLQSMARELFPDNPRAQLAFALDPKTFVGALTEGLKPQTRESGKVYFDPLTGEREGMARIDQFGDRYGFVNPETLESGFGSPRGPTYAEETGRRGQEATAAIGMGNLGVAQGNLGMRRREFDRGPASGGGAGGGFWEPF